MKLTIENLRKVGAFTGGAVLRSIEWPHAGETMRAEVWVRPLSYRTAAEVLPHVSVPDLWAQRIALCICEENGAPVFRLSDITGVDEDGNPIMLGDKEQGQLDIALFWALVAVIAEVSGLGKTTVNSGQSKNSGTSSSSTASAAARSRKRKTV